MPIFELNIFWIIVSPSYYWLMYGLSFIIWYLILKKRKIINWDMLDDLLFYIFLGVILWGRLGYVLFYNFNYYIDNIFAIFKIWEWWMSFHGGVIWVITAMFFFSKKHKLNYYKLADEVIYILPLGLFLWRIWNYINKELLWYSDYTWPLAVYKENIGYFPSPLLEAFLEWIILFILLFFIDKYKQFSGQVACVFLIGYGISRIFVEMFFRQPDNHIWYVFWFLTIGEILTLPMIIWWVYFYYKLNKLK